LNAWDILNQTHLEMTFKNFEMFYQYTIRFNDEKRLCKSNTFFVCVHGLPLEGIGDVPDDGKSKNLQIFPS